MSKSGSIHNDPNQMKSKRILKLAELVSEGGDHENFDDAAQENHNDSDSSSDTSDEKSEFETDYTQLHPVCVDETTSIDSEREFSGFTANQSLTKEIVMKKKPKSTQYKKTHCKFCEDEVVSKHFSRHLQRQHREELEVKELLSYSAGSKDRKNLIALIRNDGNLENGLKGDVIPKRRQGNWEEKKFYLCQFCKGWYQQLNLSRHQKKCTFKPDGCAETRLIDSMIFTACHQKYGEIISKLTAKNELFRNMRADEVAEEAMNDLLIVSWGDDLLKKSNPNRSQHHITEKMRLCARFLKNMKKLGPYSDLLSCLKSEAFDHIIEAVKQLAKFDQEKKTFGAGSHALHFGTYLIKLAELKKKIILRKKISIREDRREALQELDWFRDLVKSHWTIEVGSLALKDLNAKNARKPKLIPLTEDIMKLKAFVDKESKRAYLNLSRSTDVFSFRNLMETTMVSLIIHNRKRVGDIQYLLIGDYESHIQKPVTHQPELYAALSEKEKILTQNYQRVVGLGKGSKQVPLLIPKPEQKYLRCLYDIRKSEPWFNSENKFFFTLPNSTTGKWLDGCSTVRKYANTCGATYPELLTTNRLRKHISTVTQLLNLKDNEVDQLCTFMGHTRNTRDKYYKLPDDVYQTAKVAKLLLLMERGNAAQYKNKSLNEIEINANEEVDVEEDENEAAVHIYPSKSTTHKRSNVNNPETENYKRSRLDNENNASSIHGQSTAKQQKTKSNGSTFKRIRWTEEQKRVVKNAFKTHIKNKTPPKQQECLELKQKFQSELRNLDWVRIKTFVYNIYRQQRKE